MNLQELTIEIATPMVENSKVADHIGKNVRCPSLVQGTLYIMKEWSVVHHINYDNPFMVVEFIGSGRDDNGVRTLFAENPAIKEMKENDRYYFRAWNTAKNETFEFAAYMHENCVCITSSAVRVTCYAINGHESAGFDTTPKATKPARTPSAPRVQATARRTRQANVLDIDREDIVIEDDDDGLGCQDAMQLHPISFRPIKSLYCRA